MTRLGFDVGGTKVLGLALDDLGAVVGEVRVPTPDAPADLLAALAAAAAELAADRSDVTVGVGIAGFVDLRGTVRTSPNLPALADFELGPELAAAAGVPVAVDNDATCAMRAEHAFGAAEDVTDAVLVTLGTGIGGGLLVGGRVMRGVNGFAGEPGHMVVQVDGIPCPCGRRGCWERYASGTALGRLAMEAVDAGTGAAILGAAGAREAVRGEHVTEAAATGDAGALAVLDELARWVAEGVVNLVEILDVSRVVVSGGLVEAGELLLGPVRRHVGAILPEAARRRPLEVVPAELGEHAGAIGAALLPREESGAGTTVR